MSNWSLSLVAASQGEWQGHGRHWRSFLCVWLGELECVTGAKRGSLNLILDQPGKRPSWPDVRHQQVKVYQKRDSVDPEVFGVRSTAMTLALGAARPMDASGPHAMTMLRTLRPSLMRFQFVKYLDFCSSFGKISIWGKMSLKVRA